jgi:uncharacterized protein (TIGR03435 family)
MRRSRLRAFCFSIVVCGIATCSGAVAQTGASTSQKATPPSIEFEVAAIKPHPPDGTTNGGWGYSRDSFSANNLTVGLMIFLAYDLRSDSQLQNLPKWCTTEHWDISAKLGEDAVEALRKLNQQESARERRVLLDDLLAQRLQLRMHHEMRTLPIYELTVAKGGLKIKPISNGDAEKPSGWSSGDGRFDGGGVGIFALVTTLSSTPDVGRLVVDKTGLTGRYDMHMKWTPSSQQESADSGPSVFTALEEQLGLKLVSTKAPVDVLVVDHIERPSEN